MLDIFFILNLQRSIKDKTEFIKILHQVSPNLQFFHFHCVIWEQTDRKLEVGKEELLIFDGQVGFSLSLLYEMLLIPFNFQSF